MDIMNGRIQAETVLLPACYAGVTRDDDRGNALGMASAFLLRDSSVVVGASKPVFDQLMPWYSTLMVHHLIGGMNSQAAARRARTALSTFEWPADYLTAVKAAFRIAFPRIMPGGEAYEAEVAWLVGHHGMTQKDASERIEQVLAELFDTQRGRGQWWWRKASLAAMWLDNAQKQNAKGGDMLPAADKEKILNALVEGLLNPPQDERDAVIDHARDLACFIQIYGRQESIFNIDPVVPKCHCR